MTTPACMLLVVVAGAAGCPSPPATPDACRADITVAWTRLALGEMAKLSHDQCMKLDENTRSVTHAPGLGGGCGERRHSY